MKKSTRGKPTVGSSLDQYLEENGIREEVEAVAQKRVLAWKIQEAMRAQGITKTEMANRMATSRAALDRLLDPDNVSVTLTTMSRAAAAIGTRLQLDLAPQRRRPSAAARGIAAPPAPKYRRR